MAAHDGHRVGPGRPRRPVPRRRGTARSPGTLAAPDGALAARFGFGSLWVTLAGGKVAPGRPRHGKVLATYEVGVGARFLTVGDDAVWTLDASDGTVSRVDPETGEVSSVLVSDPPISGGDIAADLGAVWARTTSGVTRVDPATVDADRPDPDHARAAASVAAAAELAVAVRPRPPRRAPGTAGSLGG